MPKASIQKYLMLSPNIILTDYLHFLLIRTDEDIPKNRWGDENLVDILQDRLDFNPSYNNIARVYEEFKKELYKDLSIESFCDSFTQH